MRTLILPQEVLTRHFNGGTPDLVAITDFSEIKPDASQCLLVDLGKNQADVVEVGKVEHRPALRHPTQRGNLREERDCLEAIRYALITFSAKGVPESRKSYDLTGMRDGATDYEITRPQIERGVVYRFVPTEAEEEETAAYREPEELGVQFEDDGLPF